MDSVPRSTQSSIHHRVPAAVWRWQSRTRRAAHLWPPVIPCLIREVVIGLPSTADDPPFWLTRQFHLSLTRACVDGTEPGFSFVLAE